MELSGGWCELLYESAALALRARRNALAPILGIGRELVQRELVVGMQNENVAPGPSFGSAQSLPSWLSMMDRQSERPMPMPSLFVV